MSEQEIKSRDLLADFQVGVDNVIFSVDSERNRVLVLLTKRTSPPDQEHWSLPGTFVRVGESLEQAAYRVMSEKIRVNDLYLEQLYSFGDTFVPDPMEMFKEGSKAELSAVRYLSVSYFALVRFESAEVLGQAEERTAWFPVEGRSLDIQLAFNHGEILRYGYGRLQNKVTYSPLAFEVLPHRFTLN
ncbi:MAG: NUDIX domain-containing protein, partial [Cyanobacteria bacterium P01_F01_bin.42]